jgi:hypothetical protein
MGPSITSGTKGKISYSIFISEMKTLCVYRTVNTFRGISTAKAIHLIDVTTLDSVVPDPRFVRHKPKTIVSIPIVKAFHSIFLPVLTKNSFSGNQFFAAESKGNLEDAIFRYCLHLYSL